jgi:hypothetical protein
MRRVGIGLFVLAALGGGVFAHQALAGLPGYFEWVLWEETESVGAGASPTEPPVPSGGSWGRTLGGPTARRIGIAWRRGRCGRARVSPRACSVCPIP